MMDYTRQALKDQIYMDMAKSISQLSKDENTKVGAIIVAADGTPVSWGYNGTVSGFRDEVIPHSREIKKLLYLENDKIQRLSSNKYPFMCQAEENAMDFGDNNKLNGSTLYVTGMPCPNCALKIARKKISRVVITPVKKDESSTVGKNEEISKFIFAEANIELYIGNKIIDIRRYNFTQKVRF